MNRKYMKKAKQKRSSKLCEEIIASGSASSISQWKQLILDLEELILNYMKNL